MTTFVCKTSSKSELAALYGMGKDNFRRFCLKNNINFGRRKVLEPLEVQQLVIALGPPQLVLQFDSITVPLPLSA